MMSRILLYINLIFLLLLFSCGDLIVDPGPEPAIDLIWLKTLKNGSIISPEYPILFEILPPIPEPSDDAEQETIGAEEETEILPEPAAEDARAEDALTLEIFLYRDSELFLKTGPETLEINQEYPLNYAEMAEAEIETGQYLLVFILYRGTKKIAEKEVNFFFAKETYNISSIESYPPVIYPNIMVELKAELEIPADANPYLRWQANNGFFTSGYLQDGLDTIEWPAPSQEGIYAISLEIFPEGPGPGEEFSFTSAIIMDLNLIVSDFQKPSHRNLYPAESYFTLFHLAGDFKGFIVSKPEGPVEIEAVAFEKPLLVIKDDDLGYQLNGINGLQVPVFLFPVDNGNLQPFTLSMGLEVETQSSPKNILSCRSDDELFLFKIFIDSDGFYKCLLRTADREVEIPSRIKTVPRRFLLSLSVQPQEGNLYFTWFYDGVQVDRYQTTLSCNNLTGRGSAIIGGGQGFQGIIDELGVYFQDLQGRPAIDPGLFSMVTRQQQPTAFVFADGFDGLYLAADLTCSGTYSLEGGFLNLAEKTVLSLPALELNEDLLACTVWASGHAQSGLSLATETRILLRIMFSGEIRKAEVVLETFAAETPLRFKLDKNNARILFNTAEDVLSIPLPELADLAEINLEFFNDGKDPLVLDKLSLLKDLHAE